MKIYVSGSMQGQSDHGFDQFNKAAKQIREAFPICQVINPAELFQPIGFSGSNWQKCLKRDIQLLVECDYLVLLEGWELSPGASLEKYVAELLGIITINLEDFLLCTLKKTFERNKSVDFNLLFRQITIWQQKTFGKRTDPRPPIHHLEKEVKQLLENPTDLLEYADCFILLFNAADIAGYSAEDLLNGIRQKFEINQERKWGKPDSKGVVLHVKE